MMQKGRESSLHSVRVHVSPFVYLVSFASDFPAFLHYVFSFKGGCRQKLVASSLCGCLPLFPGDLLLTTGSFQSHFLHSTLPFSKLHDIGKILEQFPGVSADTRQEFSKLPATLNSGKRNRTVITFRQIENHGATCGLHTQQATDNSSEKAPSGVQNLVVTANDLLEQLRATIEDLKAESAPVSPEDQDSC